MTTLAEQIYRQGGVISAVCHGVAGLLALEDEQGQSLIKDRKIASFSKEEEVLSGMKAQVPFLLENELKAVGVSYKQTVLPFTAYIVVFATVLKCNLSTVNFD